MSDNGSPFVVWMPGVLTRFGKTLRELEIRHIRTQITPWTNGKVERFWETLHAEVLDRQVFRSLAMAEAAFAEYANYFNYHRLSSAIGWLKNRPERHGFSCPPRRPPQLWKACRSTAT